MTLEEKMNSLPTKPGVYLFLDSFAKAIYVGKASSLQHRVRSYFRNTQQPLRIKAMLRRAKDINFIVTDTEVEALILECNLIKEYRPRYNVNFKDDKSYPYLKLTNEPFARLEVCRRPEKDGSKYFGPYTNVGALRQTMRLMKKIFPLRTCRQYLVKGQTKRPCLNYQIKQCLAPCNGQVTEEEYAGLVKQVELFLEGRQDTLLREIENEMKEAAKHLKFERAARLRDQYHAILEIVKRQKIIFADSKNRDVVALAVEKGDAGVQLFRIRDGKLVGQEYYRLTNTDDLEKAEVIEAFIKNFYGRTPFIPQEIILSLLPPDKDLLEEWLFHLKGRKVLLKVPQRGSKKGLLEMATRNAEIQLKEIRQGEKEVNNITTNSLLALSDLLKINVLPDRIEGYDISHFAGGETVGSMVVFKKGIPAKEDYCRYAIRQSRKADDYGALQEMVRRRFSHRDRPLPDAILIDGGKGQLKAVQDVMTELSLQKIPLMALAEEEELLFLAGEHSPLRLPAGNSMLKLLQRIRDEAHRFAINYHRVLRSKKALESGLEKIPTIGKKRRKELLKYFGSLEEIEKASKEKLAAVPSMNRLAAENLYRYLHGGGPV